MKNYVKITTAITLALSLNGCIAATIFTGAEAAKTIAEERSTGTRVDDNAIALAINDKFVQKSFEGLFTSVSTSILEGRVMLVGEVTTEALKKQAEELTWKVNGVKEVINELEVKQSGGIAEYANDAWIGNQIRSRMLFTKDINSVNYKTKVVAGTVYILGISQSDHEAKVVTQIARITKGVNRVVTNIIAKNDPRRGIWAEATHTNQQ